MIGTVAMSTVVGVTIAYYVYKSQYSDQCDALGLSLVVKYLPLGVL